MNETRTTISREITAADLAKAAAQIEALQYMAGKAGQAVSTVGESEEYTENFKVLTDLVQRLRAEIAGGREALAEQELRNDIQPIEYRPL